MRLWLAIVRSSLMITTPCEYNTLIYPTGEKVSIDLNSIKKTCTRIQVAYPKVWFPFPYFITWESPSSTFKVHSYLLSLDWNGDMHTRVHTCQVTCVEMQGQPARVTYPCGSQGVNSDCQAHWQVSLPVDLARGPSFLNFLLKYFNDLIVRLGCLSSERTNKWNS